MHSKSRSWGKHGQEFLVPGQNVNDAMDANKATHGQGIPLMP